MDLMKIGAQLLMSKLGSDGASKAGGEESIAAALGGLLSNSGGGLDLGNIVSNLQSKGMGSIAESWLGDGGNAQISADQVRDLVGADKIQSMASQLGSDEGSLLSGLQEALPQMLDKGSSGGSLLDNLDAGSLVSGFAKKFF